MALLRAAQPALGVRADAAAVAGMTELLRVVLTARGSAAADAAQALLGTSSNGLLPVGTVAALVVLIRALRSVSTRSVSSCTGRPAGSCFAVLFAAGS